MTGRLVKWDASRGFGFIQAGAGAPQIFVHISKFRDRKRPPVVGAELDFQVARDLQNRLSAADVRYAGAPAARPHPHRRSKSEEASAWPAAFVAAVALGAIAALAVTGFVPWWVPVFVPRSRGSQSRGRPGSDHHTYSTCAQSFCVSRALASAPCV
jgi:cold shock CspA family protein